MIPMAGLAAVLRTPDNLEALCDRHGVAAVVDALRHEGVAPYVAWLRPDASALTDDRRRSVLDAAIQHTELHRVCAHLAAEDIAAVIFKGAAWAHTDYPEPWCRPSIDIDLLVSPDDRVRAFDAVTRFGYRRAGRLPGEFVNGQEVFERTIVAGTTMALDLHWHVSNRVWMRQLLPTSDLIARSVPAPFAGESARRVCDDDGVLIACLHPAAHHSRRTLMKWSLDVALLARRSSPQDAGRFRARAKSLGVSAIVARALTDARRLVDGDAVPLLHADMVHAMSTDGADDPSRAWLDPHRDQLQDAVDDFRALSGWRDRMRLLREHLLPPVSFMRAKYGATPTVVLPALYAHRVMSGGVKWMFYWTRDRWLSRFEASRGGGPAGSATPPRDADD